MHRRRIYCETAPAEALSDPRTVALLARFGVAPVLALSPSTDLPARAILARFKDAGLDAAVWPMVSDDAGRWLNAGNAATFAEYVERIADDLSPREMLLDLEPPIAAVRAALGATAVNVHNLERGPSPVAHRAAREALTGLVSRLHDRGIAVSAAATPVILLDPDEGDARPWQERLGTPVDGLPWDHVSPMLYTSILEGWSRGVLGRPDARALLAEGTRATLARFGAQAGVSLGAVGTGAFGDEPTYRSVTELADDVAITRALGIDDLALFDLGGVLLRPPAEAWIEAFATTPAAREVPAPTLRSRATLASAVGAGRVLGVLSRLRQVVAGSPRTSCEVQ